MGVRADGVSFLTRRGGAASTGGLTVGWDLGEVVDAIVDEGLERDAAGGAAGLGRLASGEVAGEGAA